MLEGTAKALLDLLQRIDQTPDLTYETLVEAQKAAVAREQEKLDELLKLEGLCDATVLRSPTGRKLRKDRNRPRKNRLTVRQEERINRSLDELVVGDPETAVPDDSAEKSHV